MIVGIFLGILLLLVTCVLLLRYCRSFRSQSENVKELEKDALRQEQKRSSCSSDATVFIELSSNSSIESEIIPAGTWADEKKSSTVAGYEDDGRVFDETHTLGHETYETSDWQSQKTIDSSIHNDTLAEQSAASAVSYIERIRAPANVFKFFSELESKDGKMDHSYSEQDLYTRRGARRTIQVSDESESNEKKNVQQSWTVEKVDDGNPTPTKLQGCMDHLSEGKSDTPRHSCSIIPLKEVRQLQGVSQPLFDGHQSEAEEVLSLESYSEPWGSSSCGSYYGSFPRPQEEKPDASPNISSDMRASWSSVYLTAAFCDKGQESCNVLQELRSLKEPDETWVGNNSAKLIEPQLGLQIDMPCTHTAKIHRRGQTCDTAVERSKNLDTSSATKRSTNDTKCSTPSSMEPENQRLDDYSEEVSQTPQLDSWRFEVKSVQHE